MTFEEFKRRARVIFRIDLESYKENQLRRRINSFMQKHRVQNYTDFLILLKTRRGVYEAFFNHLTINVSEFFRDPKKFEELEKEHLPALLRNKKTLKIWSAACSNGAEPYSVAIILDEKTPGVRHRILATDVDRNVLARAALGKYGADAVKNVSPDRLARYFTKEDNGYKISDVLKRKVTFKHHDLLQDRYDTGFDLILCRNVTIYFTREAQERVNSQFAKSLNEGGILFTGGSEMIFNYQELGFEKISHCFYRKKTNKTKGAGHVKV